MPDVDFDAAYVGTPPWDIGRAQGAIARLFGAGEVRGAVLDVGCGTGEHALLAVTNGLPSWGVDASATAIERARAKALERGLAARFEVADALDLGALGMRFDSVIDTGLFHVFDDAPREAYVRSLGSVVQPGGRAWILCFSDRVPPIESGPRRISEAEIQASFAVGWRVERIDPAEFEVVNLPFDSFPAWLATISKL